MKIVNICLTSPYRIGLGYQENLLSKYQSFDDNNEVTVITSYFLSNENVKNNSEENDGKVKIIRLKDGLIRILNIVFRHYKGLNNALEKEKPDFIFVHGVQFIDSLIICKYLKNNKKVRCVVDNHADSTNSAMSLPLVLFHKTLWRYCAKRINKYVSMFYGVIPIRCDFIKEMYDIPNDKIDLLVMGGDDELIKSAELNRNRTRKQLKIKEDDFLIVTGGKIDKFKTNTIDLIKEVNNLNNINVKLIIFGSVEKEIEKEFKESLTNKTFYIGWVNQEEIYNLLCASDLAFFPGRHSVLWEQVVACGLPVIFKDIYNTKHVDIGGNCLFMKDASEIKELLNYVLNKDNYMKMYKTANSKNKEQFYYSNIAKKSLEFAYKDK